MHSEQRVCGCVQPSAGTQSVRTLSALPPILFHGPVHGEPGTVCEHGLLTVPDGVWDLAVRRVAVIAPLARADLAAPLPKLRYGTR